MVWRPSSPPSPLPSERTPLDTLIAQVAQGTTLDEERLIDRTHLLDLLLKVREGTLIIDERAEREAFYEWAEPNLNRRWHVVPVTRTGVLVAL